MNPLEFNLIQNRFYNSRRFPFASCNHNSGDFVLIDFSCLAHDPKKAFYFRRFSWVCTVCTILESTKSLWNIARSKLNTQKLHVDCCLISWTDLNWLWTAMFHFLKWFLKHVANQTGANWRLLTFDKTFFDKNKWITFKKIKLNYRHLIPRDF